MRKLTAAAILTATAAVLAFRPSREWLGDALIDAGITWRTAILRHQRAPPPTAREERRS